MQYFCFIFTAIFFAGCVQTKNEHASDNIRSAGNVGEPSAAIPEKTEEYGDEYGGRAPVNMDSLTYYLSEAQKIRQELEDKLKNATPEQADSIYWSGDFRYETAQIERINQLILPVIERWGLNGGEIAVMQDGKIFDLLKQEGLEPEYMGEGYAELRVNAYYYFNIFSPYLTEKNRDFLKINSENDHIIEMDAGLVVPLDSLIEKCIKWERFLNKYPNVEQRKLITSQYGLYMALVMFCTYDNTPAFDHRTKTADKYVLETVNKAIAKYSGFQTAKILEHYVSELKKTNYKYTRQLENNVMRMGILKEFDRTDAYY
jgi:hypothetical protein